MPLDGSAGRQSSCSAAGLRRDFGRQPQWLARLRALCLKLSVAEGKLAYAVAGGGTAYGHGVSRSLPDIERTLRSVAALVAGGQNGPQYSANLIGPGPCSRTG